MSRLEAITHYENALKQGKKYVDNCLSRGEDPYPRVLEDLVNMAEVSSVNIGLIEVPIDRIIGTRASGRKMSFAGNFMPLMDARSEFGVKWINLCEAHMNEGITDPISCFEYLGDFYVQEGHKRVSVMKSFGATDISGIVTRLVPPLSDDPEIQLYYEFLNFYKLSKTYLVRFTQPGCYARLQAALGFEADEVWSEEARKSFATVFTRIAEAYAKMNSEKLPLTAGDVMLSCLRVHPYPELREQTDDEIQNNLKELWPDLRLLASGQPISVSTAPEEKSKPILRFILGSPNLHAAFIYNYDPATSPWESAHLQGQKYLEDKLGGSITVSSFLCGEDPDETMEEAVKQGANVIFATTPTLLASCRKLAAKYKNIAVFNCTLSMPYAGVRSYYGRIYEGKFIAGAIAGAMAEQDRIGYVASAPIMGAIASINAYALGARLTNPRAVISLKWSCLPGDPIREFTEEGITVISNRSVGSFSSEMTWESGTFMIRPDDSFQPLVYPGWNWGIYYEKTIQTLLNSGIDALRDSRNAVNDWWGISTGMVSVELDEHLPDGMKVLSGYLTDGILTGIIDPFVTPLRDQQGNSISDGTRAFSAEELMRMDWLCENVDGSIPEWDALTQQSRSLIRLLGIYRETIPPEPKEGGLQQPADGSQ